jgi:hypothetical protein
VEEEQTAPLHRRQAPMTGKVDIQATAAGAAVLKQQATPEVGKAGAAPAAPAPGHEVQPVPFAKLFW